MLCCTFDQSVEEEEVGGREKERKANVFYVGSGRSKVSSESVQGDLFSKKIILT